jgi:arsenate reductase (thioredoxin)
MAKKQKVRVLFICVGNACRSPMAEAIARRDANDVIEPASVGLFPLGHIPMFTTAILLKNGYPVDGLRSKGITRELWENTDLFVNLSGETIEMAFPDASDLEVWDIADPFGTDAAFYERILKEVRERVIALAVRLRERDKNGRNNSYS